MSENDPTVYTRPRVKAGVGGELGASVRWTDSRSAVLAELNTSATAGCTWAAHLGHITTLPTKAPVS